MKALNWIIKTFWNILAWFVIRDGHTINHYESKKKNMIMRPDGFISVWKDSSGNGNDAKSFPEEGYEVTELIIRDIHEGKIKRKIIYMALKYKYCKNL